MGLSPKLIFIITIIIAALVSLTTQHAAKPRRKNAKKSSLIRIVLKGGKNNPEEAATTTTASSNLISSNLIRNKKKKETRKSKIQRLSSKINNKKKENNNGDKGAKKNQGEAHTKKKPKLPVQIVSSRFIKRCPLPKSTMVLSAKRTQNKKKRCSNVCIKRLGRFCMAFVNGCFVMPKCHLCMQYCYRKCHKDDTSRCHKKIYCNSTCTAYQN